MVGDEDCDGLPDDTTETAAFDYWTEGELGPRLRILPDPERGTPTALLAAIACIPLRDLLEMLSHPTGTQDAFYAAADLRIAISDWVAAGKPGIVQDNDSE